MAGATENRAITCSDMMLDERPALTCVDDYARLSQLAAKCCGGGPSYCPAPQLCMDPAAFDPSAAVEYLCYQVGLAAAECPATCYPFQREGMDYCHCPASADDASCAELLPGEIARLDICCVCACEDKGPRARDTVCWVRERAGRGHGADEGTRCGWMWQEPRRAGGARARRQRASGAGPTARTTMTLSPEVPTSAAEAGRRTAQRHSCAWIRLRSTRLPNIAGLNVMAGSRRILRQTTATPSRAMLCRVRTSSLKLFLSEAVFWAFVSSLSLSLRPPFSLTLHPQQEFVDVRPAEVAISPRQHVGPTSL